jgi:TolA-binding protein
MNENYVIDVIANLARRVSSLEQQLRDTQGNVEKLAEELATVRHVSKPLSSAKLLAEAFEALGHYERSRGIR